MKSERLRNWSEVPGLATDKESYGSPGLISQPTLSTTLKEDGALTDTESLCFNGSHSFEGPPLSQEASDAREGQGVQAPDLPAGL